MKMNLNNNNTCIYTNFKLSLFFALFISISMQQVFAAHRIDLLNTIGWERTKNEKWPSMDMAADKMSYGMQNAAERGLLKASPITRELTLSWIDQPNAYQFSEGIKSTAFDSGIWNTGTTQISTRLDTPKQTTGYYDLWRYEGRLPYRFSWNMWQHALPSIDPEVAKALYATMGYMGVGIDYNPWIWLLGAGSEGDGDSVTRACLGPDIPALPGKEDFVKNELEQCPAWIKGDFENMEASGEGMLRALNSGWRFVGMHGIGSHLIRLFVQRLEDAMARNPQYLTLERVRSMRHGFSHGTMLGKVPDVVDMAIKYNLYLPIDVERSLTDETEAIPEFYGPEGFEFLSPVKSLIDAGVKVLSDTGGGSLHDVEVFVTRIHPQSGEVFNPEERVDRVTSFKLHSIAPAEFAFSETMTGSLEVGKFADFMVIDKDFLDPVEVPDVEIGELNVYMTVIGGATVWTNNNAPDEFKQLPHVYGRDFELDRKAEYKLGSTPD
jgi:hypothetical protein